MTIFKIAREISNVMWESLKILAILLLKIQRKPDMSTGHKDVGHKDVGHCDGLTLNYRGRRLQSICLNLCHPASYYDKIQICAGDFFFLPESDVAWFDDKQIRGRRPHAEVVWSNVVIAKVDFGGTLEMEKVL
jgi:hypothetical protein